jgi:transcription initiation factor IIE alpha subunit
MNKDENLESLANHMAFKLNAYESASDATKEIAELFSMDYDAVRQVLLRFYRAGFVDGHKIASGYKFDEWGNLIP